MSAPVAIAIMRGPEHVYVLANDAYRQFLGNRELVGQPRKAVLPDEASLSGILDRVYASGTPYSGKEFPFLVDRGAGFRDQAWFNFICTPTRDDDRQIDGVVTFAVEVTEHVQARKQLEALAGELGQAANARDEFLTIASHELRTPLTPIVLQIQLLRRHLDRAPRGTLHVSEILPRIATIERNVERVAELVGTLLDVSRITARRLDLTLAQVDVMRLVHDVVERARDVLEASRSTLIIEGPPALTGTWDRLRLDQIVTNLVSNAIKYGRGEPIHLTLSRSEHAATLRIVDRGIGIAPEDQARIFERFERAVPAKHYGGFGLGLWIVRQLVEALGGVIRVESELDAGSTFTVELPLHHS